MPAIATWGDLLPYRYGDLNTWGDPLADRRVGEALAKKSVVWDGPAVRADWEQSRPPLTAVPFFRDPFARDRAQGTGWGQRDSQAPAWTHPFNPEFYGVNSKAVTRTITDPLNRTVSNGWASPPGQALSWLPYSGVTGSLSPVPSPLNPTFDGGLWNWTASGGATIALALDFTHTGNYSIKITPDGVGTPVVASEEFAAIAGVTYTLSGYGALGAGGSSAGRSLSVEWRDAAHAVISTSTIGVTLNTVGQWLPFGPTDFVAPALTAFAVIKLVGGVGVTSAWHMDEVLLYARKADYSANGTYGQITCNAQSELDALMLPVNMANFDMYIDTGLNSIVTPTGGPLYTFFDFRMQNTKLTYRLQMAYQTSGKIDFTMQHFANSYGPASPMTGAVSSGFNTSDDLTIHIQCIGNTMKVRWYPWGTAEPTAWNMIVSTSDGAAFELSGSSQIRIGCLRDSTNTNASPVFNFKNFSISETQPAGAYCANAQPGFVEAALLNTAPMLDFDYRYKVCTDSYSQGSACSAFALGRVVDFSNYVRFRLDFNLDKVLGWGFEEFIAGVGSGSITAGLVRDNSNEGIHEINQFYWIRFRGEGSTLSAKVWRDGNPEPATWNGTAQTNWLTPGQVGTHHRALSTTQQPLPMRFTTQSFTLNGFETLDTGSAVSVSTSLDDGMPSDVTNTNGLALASAGADLVPPLSWQKSAAAYYSPFRTDSVINAYPRDVAPVTVDANIVAADGVRPTRIFTGQMTDMPAEGTDAKVTAVSQSLRKLNKLVQPPPVWGDARGLTGTWPVSWALAQCGLYASPPPRTGCLYWQPMHGSIHPFLHQAEPSDEYHEGLRKVSFVTPAFTVRPTFVPGPFVTGVYAHVDSQLRLQTNSQDMAFAYGQDMFSRTASQGRMEFWVRTDTDVDTSNPPGGGGSVPNLTAFDGVVDASHRLTMGLGKDYRLFVTINDGFTNQTVFSTNVVPQDGQWHFCGIAYSFAAPTAWFKIDNLPMDTRTPPTTWFTSGLQLHDSFTGNFQLYTFIPMAELQITSGAQARPDGGSAGGDPRWLNDPTYWEPFDAGAILRPSTNINPEALVEMQPRRAIELISDWAQAELAQTGFDAQDRFLYLTMPYWVEPAQQSVAETITTDDNLAELNVRYDVTKVRNSVSVQYNQTRVDNNAYGTLFSSSMTGPLPQGTTNYTFALDKPNVYLSRTVQLLQPADFANLPTIACWASFNDQPDGTGSSYATSSDILASIIFYNAGIVTFQFTTLTGKQWYFANSGSVPTIAAQGIPVSISQASEIGQNATSIARRGEQGLVASISAIQDAPWARFIAAELAARLAYPRWRAEGVRVFGDPRRKVGSLVRLQDKDGSSLDSPGRIVSIGHTIDGPKYEQTLTIVQASLIAVWDQASWDDGSVWGL